MAMYPRTTTRELKGQLETKSIPASRRRDSAAHAGPLQTGIRSESIFGSRAALQFPRPAVVGEGPGLPWFAERRATVVIVSQLLSLTRTQKRSFSAVGSTQENR